MLARAGDRTEQVVIEAFRRFRVADFIGTRDLAIILVETKCITVSVAVNAMPLRGWTLVLVLTCSHVT